MQNVSLIIVGGIIILGIAIWYFAVDKTTNQREGSQQLTAEQVVDLEVQAQQQFEANGGEM